jgi:tetratricopeptide (TPR) repeat protein
MNSKRNTTPLVCLAISLLLLAASVVRAENPDEFVNKAEAAFDQADIISAMAWYRRAAEMGHAPSQSRLAYLLDNAEENEEAVKWYRLAAEQGFAEAEFGLAQMYASGEGIERDSDKAVELFTRAANRGHYQAIHVLALAYEKGQLGLRIDYDKALTWLNTGVDAGDPWAIKWLAQAYRRGKLGLRIDPQRAEALEKQLLNDNTSTPAER